jgi:hypothetical protein
MSQRYEILSPIPAADDECWGSCYVGVHDKARLSLDDTQVVVKRPMSEDGACPHAHTHTIVSVHHHPRDFERKGDPAPDWSDGSILDLMATTAWTDPDAP